MRRGPGLVATKAALIAVMAVGSVAMWVVTPVAWVWAASQFSSASQLQLWHVLMILVGIPATMAVIGKGLSALNRLYGRVSGQQSTVRVQLPWHRSMRGERKPASPTTVLDVVMVCSVALALTAFAIWFFLFAGSSLPGSP